jgi:hypothetical protein
MTSAPGSISLGLIHPRFARPPSLDGTRSAASANAGDMGNGGWTGFFSRAY